eukprot:2901138-Amphidinium_carterae.1
MPCHQRPSSSLATCHQPEYRSHHHRLLPHPLCRSLPDGAATFKNFWLLVGPKLPGRPEEGPVSGCVPEEVLARAPRDVPTREWLNTMSSSAAWTVAGRR